MSSQFRQLCYVLVGLFVLSSFVQGDDLLTVDNMETTEGSTWPSSPNDVVFLNADSSGYDPEDDSELLKDTQDVNRYTSFGKREENRNVLFKPIDIRFVPVYFTEFYSKVNPNFGSSHFGFPYFDKTEYLNDDIDLDFLRIPQFSHKLIDKRPLTEMENTDLWKRFPLELFSRRTPQYSHNFIGKRSSEQDISNSKIFTDILREETSDDTQRNIRKRSENNLWLQEPSYSLSRGSFASSNKIPTSRIPNSSDSSKNYRFHVISKRDIIAEHTDPHLRYNSIESSDDYVADVLSEERHEEDAGNEAVYEIGKITTVEPDMVSTEDSPENRQSSLSKLSLNLLEKRPNFGHRFVGKRPSFGHTFVEKRPSFGHRFVGKRPSFGHKFVGKRPSFGHRFVGKRPSFSHKFVGKRPSFGHRFVGKRPSFSHKFVGKRPSFSHKFVGKRPSFGHRFVGKRSIVEDSVIGNHQQSSDSSFVEQRPNFGHTFIGKRSYFDNEFVEKRPKFAHKFIGKRPSFAHKFIGKRPSFGHKFVGKRPSFGHKFIGKRPSFGHRFIGKRSYIDSSVTGKRPSFAHKFIGKRLSFDDEFIENKRSYLDSSITGKRPNFAHKFIGKRPRFGHTFIGKRSYVDKNLIVERPNFAHKFIGKRPSFGHKFVGKRPNFGHKFVGKRPSFGHKFVGKRPSFGHKFVGKRNQDVGATSASDLVVGLRDGFVEEVEDDDKSIASTESDRFETLNNEDNSAEIVASKTNSNGSTAETEILAGNDIIGNQESDSNNPDNFVKIQQRCCERPLTTWLTDLGFVGKRGRGFGHRFVGKRGNDSETVNKDALLGDRFGTDSESNTEEVFRVDEVKETEDDSEAANKDNLLSDRFGTDSESNTEEVFRVDEVKETANDYDDKANDNRNILSSM